MIRKQDILDRAAEWQLRPEIVEKDYVLGWLLAGVATTPLREHWIFKGGTSIKKCYFETYRFSEDLDFSLLAGAAYGQSEVAGNLGALVGRVSELSGIEFPPDAIVVRERRNLQGQHTFEGRVGYRGPLVYPGTPKVLFDLTQHEAVLERPTDRLIVHPYPDDLPDNAAVRVAPYYGAQPGATRGGWPAPFVERIRRAEYPQYVWDILPMASVDQPSVLRLDRIRPIGADSANWTIEPWVLSGEGSVRAGFTPPYGFGLSLRPLAGEPAVWHMGVREGHTSLLAHLPEHDIILAMLTNALRGASGAGQSNHSRVTRLARAGAAGFATRYRCAGKVGRHLQRRPLRVPSCRGFQRTVLPRSIRRAARAYALPRG
ncbi:MAG: nucleotidyl transferase AbiEii/AbiGii toxin family protein [Acidobacteria bacterium]|nr:nucleotidyl transferase AbiEii/AbiGii toxin family protein [Acidobacteriota bacterium]